MLSILSEESPPSLPLPPAYAFVPPACGGLSIVEEILARQVSQYRKDLRLSLSHFRIQQDISARVRRLEHR